MLASRSNRTASESPHGSTSSITTESSDAEGEDMAFYPNVSEMCISRAEEIKFAENLLQLNYFKYFRIGDLRLRVSCAGFMINLTARGAESKSLVFTRKVWSWSRCSKRVRFQLIKRLIRSAILKRGGGISRPGRDDDEGATMGAIASELLAGDDEDFDEGDEESDDQEEAGGRRTPSGSGGSSRRKISNKGKTTDEASKRALLFGKR